MKLLKATSYCWIWWLHPLLVKLTTICNFSEAYSTNYEIKQCKEFKYFQYVPRCNRWRRYVTKIYLFLKIFFFCSISPHSFLVHVNSKITSCTSSNDLPSNCSPNLKNERNWKLLFSFISITLYIFFFFVNYVDFKNYGKSRL